MLYIFKINPQIIKPAAICFISSNSPTPQSYSLARQLLPSQLSWQTSQFLPPPPPPRTLHLFLAQYATKLCAQSGLWCVLWINFSPFYPHPPFFLKFPGKIKRLRCSKVFAKWLKKVAVLPQKALGTSRLMCWCVLGQMCMVPLFIIPPFCAENDVNEFIFTLSFLRLFKINTK